MSRAFGSVCTVNPNGVSSEGFALDIGTCILWAINKTSNNLEPQVQHGKQECQTKPLRGVAVILLDPQIDNRPITHQGLSGCAHLLQRNRKQRQPGFRAELWQVEILPYSSRRRSTKGIQIGGRQGHAAYYFDHARRCFNRGQQRTILESAGSPAALNCQRATALQSQNRHHHEPHPPIHGPVLKECDGLWYPGTPQTRTLVEQCQRVSRGTDRGGIKRRFGTLRIQRYLARLLFGRTRQLPESKARSDSHCGERCHCDEYKFQSPIHQIILLMTYLVTIAFLAILASLGAALFYMMRGGQKGNETSRKMARALGLRVGLSILLFACILIAWSLGYIHPTGIPQGR